MFKHEVHIHDTRVKLKYALIKLNMPLHRNVSGNLPEIVKEKTYLT